MNPAFPPAAGSEPDTSQIPATTYSGILYIIYSSGEDAALSFFWDVMDVVAGPGKVIDQTPLADGSGHEFTLDLGSDVLVLEDLRKGIPGSEITAIGARPTSDPFELPSLLAQALHHGIHLSRYSIPMSLFGRTY